MHHSVTNSEWPPNDCVFSTSDMSSVDFAILVVALTRLIARPLDPPAEVQRLPHRQLSHVLQMTYTHQGGRVVRALMRGDQFGQGCCLWRHSSEADKGLRHQIATKAIIG